MSDTCKMPLASQAGYSTSEDRMKLDKIYFIVEKYCPDYSAGNYCFSHLFVFLIFDNYLSL